MYCIDDQEGYEQEDEDTRTFSERADTFLVDLAAFVYDVNSSVGKCVCEYCKSLSIKTDSSSCINCGAPL